MRKVVMTGACGFMGTHLTKALSDKGVEVYAICRPGSLHIGRIRHLPGVRVILCGMEDWPSLPEIIEERGFDVFYHLAWEGTCGSARTDWRLQLENVASTGKAAEAAHALGCVKFIGTGSVYEQLEAELVQAKQFKNAFYYLFAKKAAGDMLSQMTVRLGMEYVWCTCYQPVGRYIRREQVTTYTVESLLRGISPSYGPAMQPCDIVAVEDVAEGLILAGEVKLSGHRYFLGSGKPRILKEYLVEMQKLVRPEIPLGIGALPDDGMRFRKEWFDIGPFARETGFAPKRTFQEALEHTKSWVEENFTA